VLLVTNDPDGERFIVRACSSSGSRTSPSPRHISVRRHWCWGRVYAYQSAQTLCSSSRKKDVVSLDAALGCQYPAASTRTEAPADVTNYTAHADRQTLRRPASGRGFDFEDNVWIESLNFKGTLRYLGEIVGK
jgi:hypothetical protein